MRDFRFTTTSMKNSFSPGCSAEKEPGRQRSFARGTLAAALLLSLGCGASYDPDTIGSTSQALVLPSVLNLALNSAQKVAFGNDSRLIGGDVGSGGAASEVGFGRNALQSADRYALAHTIRVKTGGSIGTAYTFNASTLLNQGTAAGAVTGYSGASLPAVPAVPAVVAGSSDVQVPEFGSTTLCAGDYRTLEAQRGATLILSAGTYNVGSLILASEAKLLAAGRVVLRVAGDASLGRGVTLGPWAGGGAADLRIETAGSFLMGETGSGKAHILAGGSIDLGNAVTWNGVAWASGDISVRIGASFTREGELASTTPMIPSGEDGDLCTVDSCDPATGVHHTPVSTDDGNECTVDACAPLFGVSHTAVTDGTPCSLGSCQGGFCMESHRLAPGDVHSYFIRPNGTVWAAGQNYHYQLGNGGGSDSAVPVMVSGLSDVSSVASGDNFGVALKTDGTVWAWGQNSSFGQLGNGRTAYESTPVRVSGLTDVVAIASGAHHSLAIRRDGSLWAWGWNSLGELGDGTNTNRLVPVPVSGISDVRAIAAGSNHSLAVKKDGTVWAWGWNAYGQLGDGGTTGRTVPGQVAGLSNATSVAAGLVHSLALLSNGSVAAWGDNLFGELGDGNRGTVSRAPVAVLNVRNATSIAAGWYHSLALTSTGVVWAFGENVNHGQLGDGSGRDQPIPVALSGLGAVTEIAAGLEHSMILFGTGSVFGFGKNGTGALGDSTLMDHHTPVPSLF